MASAATDSSARTIDIRVLSQLTGSDSSVLLSALGRSTTVKDVKDKLRSDLQSQPAPDHQRLIYHGRVLARETDTLEDVFGKENFDKGGIYTLHLVVRQQPGVASQPSGTPSPATGSALPTLPQGHSATIQPSMPQLIQHPAAVMNNGQVQFHPPMMNGQPAVQIQQFQVQPQTPFTPGTQHFLGHPPPRQQSGHPMIAQQIAQHQQIHTAMMQNLGNQPRNFPFGPGLPPHVAIPSGVPVPLGPQQVNAPPTASQSERLSAQQGSASAPTASGPPEHPSQEAAQQHRPASINGSEPQSDRDQGPAGQQGQPQTATSDTPQGVITREAVGPNGERITVTFGMTTGGPQPTFPPPPPGFLPASPTAVPMGAMQMPFPQYPGAMTPSALQRQHHVMPDWPGMPPIGLGDQYHGPQHAIASMRHWHDCLLGYIDILSRQASGTPHMPRGYLSTLSLQIQNIVRLRNRAQSAINDLLLPGVYAGHGGLDSDTVATLQRLNTDFTEDLQSLRGISRELRSMSNAPRETTQEQRTQTRPAAERPAEEAPSTAPVTAYLLSSPTGPHAVVFSPQGAYVGAAASGPTLSDVARTNERLGSVLAQVRETSARSPSMTRRNRQIEDRIVRAREAVAGLNREIVNANEALNHANAAVTGMHNANVAAHGAAAARDGQAAQDQAQVAQQDQDEANHIAVILAMILRQVWLIIRISGFIWLVTRNMSNRRTILLVLASVVYLAAQAGLFGNRLERLRRHFEALLGIPQDGERPEQAAAAPGEQENAAGAQAQNGAGATATRNQSQTTRAPNPQETAERLLRERRERDRGWLMAQAVRVERALALFVASLYPGVGERHVQARERALREAREAEEQAARATEEANAVESARTEEGQSAATTQPVANDPTGNVEAVANDDATAPAESMKTPRAEEMTEHAEGSSSVVAARSEQGEGELRGRTNARAVES